MSRVAVQFAVLLSVMGSVAAAQPHGRVVGQVLDQTGAVLPGVTIDLIVNEAELTTTTDDEGHYGFDAVPAGTAELTFRLLNFSVLRRIVRVNAGDIDPAGNFVPGALDRVISAGLTVDRGQPVFLSLRVRHFGPRALIEDGSVQSSNTTLWNGEAGYRLSNKARLVLDVFDILDARVSDIDYFYTSRLRGEPEEGVDDTHVHPVLPRSAWIGLQMSF